MTVHPFDLATTPRPKEGGRFELDADPSWYQGRGVYGGVTAASLLRAMATHVPHRGRFVRSLTTHFCAPVVAEHAMDIEATLEREGASVSQTSARLLQNGKTAAFATATFGAPRKHTLSYSDIRRTDRIPDVPPPEDVPVISGTRLMPAFTDHYEFRFCLGSAPFSGADEARLGGYLRHKPPRLLDAAGLVGLIDAWPPTMIVRLDAPNRGAASIDFTVHFYRDFPLADGRPEDHFLFDVHSHWCEAGYAEERTFMFAPDGALIAECRQMIAIF